MTAEEREFLEEQQADGNRWHYVGDGVVEWGC